ncbi:MAG: RNA methyltransferase [Candidatus Nezhaarchaeota archaeon]|nr:RNA methyltransferase [Candidatus Nezhaarchaeota archaeon]
MIYLIVRMVMVEPEKGGNVGSVARVMKNFGFRQLYLVNPKAKLDEARLYAAHASDILDSVVVVSSLKEAIADVSIIVGSTAVPATSSSNLTRITIFPEELARYLSRYRAGIVAILLGRESIGLLNRELELCDVVVTIPADPKYPVLNVAMAAGIILYELYKAFEVKQKVSHAKPADRKVVEAVISHFESLLKASGLESTRLRLTVKALRNVLSRSFLASREASLLAGGFRRILLKVQSQGLD